MDVDNDNDEGFDYEEGRSTSNIIFHDHARLPRHLNWHPPDPVPVPFFLIVDEENPPGRLTICSSSSGFTVCRDEARTDYYICNPFAPRNDPDRCIGPLGGGSPPDPHPPGDEIHVDVVLATNFPLFHVICAVREEASVYTFHVHSSNTDYWISHRKINIDLQARGLRYIVPDTGVSCGRFAYWLTENPSSVLRFDIMAGNDNNRISFLELPPGSAGARMQLGRVRDDMLGLVMVKERDSTVELYTRALDNDDDNGWGEAHVFKVEKDEVAATAVVAREQDGEVILVCKEMPWPIRFESFKMEALLWVAGRVVKLERSAVDQNLYDVSVLPSAFAVSACIVFGMPHVSTRSLPKEFDFGCS